jgi:hypothetical protein
MRRRARIVTLITRRTDSNRRISIPKGCCEIDDGPHGIGPYIVYWNDGDKIVSSELTLTEFVSYVSVETQPWTDLSAGKRDQLFARGQRWTKH